MKFDKDFALQLNAASVLPVGLACMVVPKTVNKLYFTAEHAVNDSGLRHFGSTVVGMGAIMAAASKSKDDKVKRNMLIARAAQHAGCFAVAAFGQRDNHEPKHGRGLIIASNAVLGGICLAAACKK